MSSTGEQSMRRVVLVPSNERRNRLIASRAEHGGRIRDAEAALTAIGSSGGPPLTGVGLAVG